MPPKVEKYLIKQENEGKLIKVEAEKNEFNHHVYELVGSNEDGYVYRYAGSGIDMSLK